MDQFVEPLEPTSVPAIPAKLNISRLDALIRALTNPADLELDTAELTKGQPSHFKRQQVELACRKEPYLVVLKLHRHLLIGGPDEDGKLNFPFPGLKSQGVKWFVQENREHWVVVPPAGYRVIWRSVRLPHHFELYPALDALEADLRRRDCPSRAILQEKIITALKLPDLIVPISQL